MSLPTSMSVVGGFVFCDGSRPVAIVTLHVDVQESV